MKEVREQQQQQGLYRSEFEHDNCGIGAVVNIKGKKTHDTVANALKIVEHLEHRAGKDAEGKTGDGVGILLQISHKFFKKACKKEGFEIGDEREYGIANPDDAKLPDMSKLKEAAKHTDIDNLVIDTNNNTVYFKDPDMKLDVGAIAKGYAVEQITEWAKANLWTSAAISIGGNVSTFGYKNDDGKTKWTIGIENPDTSADDYLLKLNITDECIVTSGDYQRYYTVDGKKYCHIINPETLMPSEYMASVSVICKDSSFGDAMSTALFNMTIADGKKLVDSLDGIEAVWVDKKFNKTFSRGFNQYIDNEKE